MNSSEKIDLISKALIKAQREIGVAVKTAKSHHGMYADLATVIESIKEPLNNNGIVFLQFVQSHEADTVETILLHESGQYIETETRVYCQRPNDPQAFGTGISYAKRYALQAALGLPTEDDDGNAASKPPTKSQPKNTNNLTDGQKKYIENVKKLVDENLDGKAEIDPKKLTEYLVLQANKQKAVLGANTKGIPLVAQAIANKTDIETLYKDVA